MSEVNIALILFEMIETSIYTLFMTHLLKQAFDKAAKMSQAQQDVFARWVLDELDSEKRWDKAFAKSHDVLAHLAAQTLKEHAQGKTKPLHFRIS